jgi:hypothetical protein
MLPNVVEFAAVYCGVLRAGGVVVPMNPLLKAREVAYYLADSGARLTVAWHALGDQVTAGAAQAGATALLGDPVTCPPVLADAVPADNAVEREPNDTTVLLYTSGTTGRRGHRGAASGPPAGPRPQRRVHPGHCQEQRGQGQQRHHEAVAHPRRHACRPRRTRPPADRRRGAAAASAPADTARRRSRGTGPNPHPDAMATMPTTLAPVLPAPGG